MMPQFDLITMVTLFVAMALIPLLLMISTCFLKIAVVLVIVKNALGVQQVPPTMAVYGIALALTLYIMAPVFLDVKINLEALGVFNNSSGQLSEIINVSLPPMTEFMSRHTDPTVKEMLTGTTQHIWSSTRQDMGKNAEILLVIPSFVVSEIQAGFKIGFLIYLPFIVIDLLVSNLLLALGMQMVSPMTISMPLKILLFVVADGWQKLLQSLILTYAH